MNPQTIANRYKIEQELGRGGMAVVYRALDTRLQRHVALKLLHPFLATQPESAARFLRESEAIAKLHHPNIVEIFDAGVDEDSGSHYLVMELVDGPTLGEFIKEHPTKIPEIGLAMGCCLCDAVEHAHQAGIIHRDIKPENIMISSDGTMKLMDFGIARVLDAERMTASGSLVGSPAHMPPEIIEGQSYSFSCDIFSLGTVIYYMVTNTLPFQGNTPMTVFRAILDNQYQKPSRVLLSVSKSIDHVIAQCLNTEPSARYQKAGELKAAILPILEPMHFDNYHELLAKYFKDPDAFYHEALPVVKEALNSSAFQAVSEHRLPVALEKLNCVLAYDPEDPQATALLKKLRMGDRLRRQLWIAAGVILVIGLVVLGVIFLRPAPDEPKPLDQLVIAPQGSPDEPAPKASSNVELSRQENANALTPIASNLNSAAENNLAEQKTEQPPARGEKPLDSTQTAEHVDSTEVKSSDDGTVPEPAASEHRQNAAKNNKNTVKKTAESKNPANMNDTQEPENPVIADNAENVDPKQDETPAEAVPVPTTVHIVQPVFPPDAFAVINGKRYEPNSSGDIVMDLPEGRYNMMLTCARRCVQQKTTLVVDAAQNKARDVISLEWADASLVLSQPGNVSVYFVARRLDDRSQRVFHLVSKQPNAVSGFNAFGRPIQLEVYAIPTSNTLKSFDINALEKAKYASTRVSVEPGDTKIVKF